MYKYFKVFQFWNKHSRVRRWWHYIEVPTKKTLLLEVSKQYKDLMIKGADCSKDNVFFNNRAFKEISLTSKYKF